MKQQWKNHKPLLAALATLADKPANTTLLTGEVLAASRTAAPLTDIRVGAPAFDGGSAATIPASYKLGDQAASTTLHLEGDGRTQWLLSDGTADLTLSSTAGLQVNTDNPAAFNKAVYDFLASAPPRRSSASMGA